MVLYKKRLAQLGGYSHTDIKRWMPSISASMIGIEHTMTMSWMILPTTETAEGHKYHQWHGQTQTLNYISPSVFIMPAEQMIACNGSAAVKTDTTSVHNEMTQNGLFLAERALNSDAPKHLSAMASELKSLWREVDDGPVNATFVYQSSRCVTSATWI